MSFTSSSSNPLQSLNITLKALDWNYISKDCAVAGKFKARLYDKVDLYNLAQAEIRYENRLEFPWGELVGALKSLGPKEFSLASHGQIVDWVIQNQGDKPYDFFPTQACKVKFCHGLGWQGNADLAGIGILTSNVLQASLVTLFALMFGAFLCYDGRLPARIDFRARRSDGMISRAWIALNASVAVFWDTALLSAITVCTSGLIVSLQGKNWGYTQYFAILSSWVSQATIVSTWPFYSPSCTHKVIRMGGLTVVSLLTLWASLSLSLNPKWSNPRIDNFEQFCLEGTRLVASAVIIKEPRGLPIVIGLGTLALWAAHIWFYLKNGRSRWPETIPGRAWRMVLGFFWLLAFGFLWLSIASYIVTKARVKIYAGPSLKEDDWSFGQMLALAAWAPTFIDFWAVWCGNFSWIQGRLPRALPDDASTDPDGGKDRPAGKERDTVP